MNPALKDMLEIYRPSTPADYQNAAREIVQEIALLGLWRSGFFEHVAFYGGTALRIFHGLRRFSEDLDFTLAAAGDEARLERYLPNVATELEAWGFSFEAESKTEGGVTGIESAFHWGGGEITTQVLTELLRDRFAAIDFKQAAYEVRVFLQDPRELQLWSREFFEGLAAKL